MRTKVFQRVKLAHAAAGMILLTLCRFGAPAMALAMAMAWGSGLAFGRDYGKPADTAETCIDVYVENHNLPANLVGTPRYWVAAIFSKTGVQLVWHGARPR